MRENYGPGSFSDQYDNQKSRSVDRDQHPGKVTNVPFEDEMDLTTNNFNPSHGEAYKEPERKEPPHGGRTVPSERRMNNLARSDLRPDMHPGDHHYYFDDSEEVHKPDELLKKDIMKALDHSLDVHVPNLVVCVEEGVVYFEGHFPNEGIQRVASDLIASIPGVVDVFYKPMSH